MPYQFSLGSVEPGASRTRPSAWVLAAVVAVVLSCGSIRDDELHCEEAVAHLEDCCPNFDARRFNCEYQRTCNFASNPVVNERAADCIRNRGCAEMVANGTCAALIRISDAPYPSSQVDEIATEACR